MGACCGDIFKELFDKYGQDFVKLCLCEDGKKTTHTEFGKARSELEKLFGSTTTHLNSIVDSKTSELNKIYEDAKNKVAAVPGALQGIEKAAGKPLD